MKRVLVLVFLFALSTFAQTLLQTITLPRTAYYDLGYGLVYKGGALWMSSGSTATGNTGKLVALNSSGVAIDSLQITYPTIKESQGLAFDGTNFWYADRKTSRNDLMKVSSAGVVLDSFVTSGIAGGLYMGGCAWDGTGIWFSVYYPDANAALYKLNPTTKQIVDTIRVNGLQPQGVAVKGDTIFYVMDGFQSNPERIYAVNRITKDTLFSFQCPESPSLRQNPRGLAWDGQYLWLLAEPVGASVGRALFKYSLGGSGTPSLSLLSNSLLFNNIQIDSTARLTFQVRNAGNVNLVLDSIKTNVYQGVYVTQGTFPLTVKPDSIKSVTVLFKPKVNQDYKDSLTLFTNDPNFRSAYVRLAGKGIYTRPYLSTAGTFINYGNKRIRSTSYKLIEFTNAGSAKLKIDSVVIKNPIYKTEPKTISTLIDSQGVFSFRLWLQPDAYKSYTDTLKIYSNASNGNPLRMVLTTNCSAFDSTLGNIVWQGMIPDNPSTSFDDLSAKYFKNPGDLNADGVDDIVVGTDNYFLVAFNGNSSGDADVLWTCNFAPSNVNSGCIERDESLQIAPDVNADGINEIVVGTAGGNESIIMIDGKTGTRIWEVGDSVNYENGDVNGIDIKRDFNGDGYPDVLATASGNEFNGQGRFSAYALDGKTGAQIWRIDHSSQKLMKDAIVSTDFGGAVSSHASGASNGEILGFNKQGLVFWSFPTTRVAWSIAEIQNIGRSPAKDLIVGDFGGNVYAISADSGKLIWQTSIGNYIIEFLTVVPDMNKSGYADILISSLNATVTLLEGSTGAVIYNGFTSGNNLGVNIIGDANRDSIPEIGVASLDVKMYVFDIKQTNPLFTYAFGTASTAYTPENVYKMGDVDRNGTFEFVAGSRDGRVIAFSGGARGLVSSVSENLPVPDSYTLYNNYPNPFNPETTVKWYSPEQSKVTLSIYNTLGEKIMDVFSGESAAGFHSATVNMNAFSSGIYLYRLTTAKGQLTRKMMLIK